MSNSQTSRRLVLAELPPTDREKLLDFLIQNEVSFVPDEGSGKYIAKVFVQHPQGRALRRNGARARARVADGPDEVEQQSTTSPKATRRGPGTVAAACRRTPGGGSAGGTAPGVQKARASALLGVQNDLLKRYRSFCGMLKPLGQTPKAMQRTEFFRVVEDIYSARFAQEVQQLKAKAEAKEAAAAAGISDGASTSSSSSAFEKRGFPSFVANFLGKRYGLKQVVGQACWSLVSSAEQLRGRHVGAELFARFLEESLDDLDLLFLLNTRSSVRQAMLTDKRRAANCSPWQRVWHVVALPTERRPPATETALASSAPSAPRDRLDAWQAVQAIQDAVGQKELQEKLLERVNQLMAESSMAAPEGGGLDVDQFLLVATEMFHHDRGGAAKGDLDPRVQELIQALLETWDSLEDAFQVMDTKRRNTVAFSDLSRAMKGTNFEGDLRQVWEIIDCNGDGTISLKDFLSISELRAEDVHRRCKQHRKEVIRWNSWPKDLSPSVLKEARFREERLLGALAELGEAKAARPEEVRSWAVHVAISRKERHRGRLRVSKEAPSFGDDSGYAVSPEEMQHAWWSFHGNASKLPSADLAPEAEISAGEDVEATVRRLLTRATEGLVSDALAAASAQGGPPSVAGEVFVREALMCEFAPEMDSLMENLVAGDSEAWLRVLGLDVSGDEEQLGHFRECHEGLQAALSAPIRAGSVDRICQAVAATPELRAAATARAEQLVRGTLGQEVKDGGTLGKEFLSKVCLIKPASKVAASEASELPAVLFEAAEPDAELSQELPQEPLEIVSLEDSVIEEPPMVNATSMAEEEKKELFHLQKLRKERAAVSEARWYSSEESLLGHAGARKKEQAAIKLQQTFRSRSKRWQESSPDRAEAHRKDEAAIKIQTKFRKSRKSWEESSPDRAEAHRKDEAAIKIQTKFRKSRKSWEEHSREDALAKESSPDRAEAHRKDEAAIKIQTKFRKSRKSWEEHSREDALAKGEERGEEEVPQQKLAEEFVEQQERGEELREQREEMEEADETKEEGLTQELAEKEEEEDETRAKDEEEEEQAAPANAAELEEPARQEKAKEEEEEQGAPANEEEEEEGRPAPAAEVDSEGSPPAGAAAEEFADLDAF